MKIKYSEGVAGGKLLIVAFALLNLEISPEECMKKITDVLGDPVAGGESEYIVRLHWYKAIGKKKETALVSVSFGFPDAMVSVCGASKNQAKRFIQELFCRADLEPFDRVMTKKNFQMLQIHLKTKVKGQG